MQRFTNNNSFLVRRGRFKETGSKFESVSITTINFENSLNSIDCEDEFYTNYASSKEQKVYKIIENLFTEILNGNNDILKKYTFDELYYREKVVDRLINIINIFCGDEYSTNDLPYIFKLKNKKDPKIHLYITVNDNVAEILLIDLYHLSIPADIYSNGRLIQRISFRDLPKMYNKYKKNKYNLNNIEKEKTELLVSV